MEVAATSEARPLEKSLMQMSYTHNFGFSF